MTTVLKMVYRNTRTGKNMIWSLTDPTTGLKKPAVETAMVGAKAMVTIDGDTGSNIEVYDSYIYTTEKIELA